MKEKYRGYTLVELIVAISLLMIVLLGGTTLLNQNLRSGGFMEVEVDLNNSLRSILDELERSWRFGKVVAVDGIDRAGCLDLGGSGYTGTNLRVEDLTGQISVYNLSGEKIASTSSQTNQSVYLNSDAVKVNGWTIKWFCQSGINDKINVEINVSSTVLGSGVTISRTVSRDMVLLNGAVN